MQASSVSRLGIKEKMEVGGDNDKVHVLCGTATWRDEVQGGGGRGGIFSVRSR
jgi:hypothetical protein